MKPYVVRQATLDDAIKIAPMLREQDRREVLAASGEMPEAVLPRSFGDIAADGDVIFAETTDGDPILIAGVRETQPRIGAIWMIGTPLLEDYAFRYARSARRKTNEWHKRWPLLWNMAWADNDLHVRWLQFMGFTLLRRVEHRGHTFIEFARHRHVR